MNFTPLQWAGYLVRHCQGSGSLSTSEQSDLKIQRMTLELTTRIPDWSQSSVLKSLVLEIVVQLDPPPSSWANIHDLSKEIVSVASWQNSGRNEAHLGSIGAQHCVSTQCCCYWSVGDLELMKWNFNPNLFTGKRKPTPMIQSSCNWVLPLTGTTDFPGDPFSNAIARWENEELREYYSSHEILLKSLLLK